jgi:hypothetical protein
MKGNDGREDPEMKNPTVSTVASMLAPGVGQIYNGDWLRGAFWLIITPGLWIGTGGTLGWVCHAAAAYTAYSRAHQINEFRSYQS